MEKKGGIKNLFTFVLVVTAIMLTFNGCGTGFERDEHGSIISGGTIKAASLRTGDCFNDLNPEEVKELMENSGESDPVTINHVSAVPCNMPHNNEVFAQSESLFSDLNDYPSIEEISIRAENFCEPEEYKYLGIDTNLSLSERKKIVIDAFPGWYQFLFPLKPLWDSGNRKISCLLYTELARENSARNF